MDILHVCISLSIHTGIVVGKLLFSRTCIQCCIDVHVFHNTLQSCNFIHPSVFIICTQGHKGTGFKPKSLLQFVFFLMQKVTESQKSAASAASTLNLQVASSCICSLPSVVLNLCLQLWIPAKMDTSVISFEVTGLQPWNSQQYSCLAMFFVKNKFKH